MRDQQHTIQQKLFTVFSEHFQIKRVAKEISNAKQYRQKYGYDCKMSFIRNQQITFGIQYRKSALKKHKLTENMNSFQIKIILKNQYPAKPPILHCLSDSMIDLGLKPFRDYCSAIVPEWNVKYTVVDLIKSFLQLVQNANRQKMGVYKTNELFDLQKVYSWSFLQSYPVKIIKPNCTTQGFFIINCQSEVIILEENQGNNSGFLTRDLIPMQQIVSIFRSKGHGKRMLIQLKRDDKSKIAIVIESQDRQNLVNSLIQYMKQASQSLQTQSIGEESSSQDQYEEKMIDGSQQRQNSKINIEEVKETIVYYESLVSANMTSQNISNLVQMLKKAIQYYSAIGSPEFEIYLDKLKTLMSNQMTQVLLDSAETKKKQDDKSKEKFQSIIDIF